VCFQRGDVGIPAGPTRWGCWAATVTRIQPAHPGTATGFFLKRAHNSGKPLLNFPMVGQNRKGDPEGKDHLFGRVPGLVKKHSASSDRLRGLFSPNGGNTRGPKGGRRTAWGRVLLRNPAFSMGTRNSEGENPANTRADIAKQVFAKLHSSTDAIKFHLVVMALCGTRRNCFYYDQLILHGARFPAPRVFGSLVGVISAWMAGEAIPQVVDRNASRDVKKGAWRVSS